VVHLCLLCTSCAGRVEVYGTAPALDDGGLYRGDLVRGGGAVRMPAGLRTTVEAGQTCDVDHH